MAVRVVADIVKQGRRKSGVDFLAGEVKTAAPQQVENRQAGQVKDPDAVFKAGRGAPRPGQTGEAKLLHPPQPLKRRAIQDSHDLARERNIAPDRIADHAFWLIYQTQY